MSRRVIIVSEEKAAYEEKLNTLLDKYSRVLFVTVDNIRSQQIHDIRRDLRGKGVLQMGKKTLQYKCIENRAKKDDASANDKAFFTKSDEMNLLCNNTGMLFTNLEAQEIIDVLNKHRIQAPARVGTVAPCDVIIPAGNTGMEPTQTSFFQALNIATKITKGTVEIINDKKVLSTGEKVDNSTAALLQKLKISPFYFQMEVLAVWDRGVVFGAEDLKISDESIESALIEGISKITAVSLGAGIPTAASMPIIAVDAFRNLLAAAVATKYTFTEFNAEKTINDAREGKIVAAAAAPAAAKKEEKKEAKKEEKKEEKKPEPEEEEDDFGMGGLF